MNVLTKAITGILAGVIVSAGVATAETQYMDDRSTPEKLVQSFYNAINKNSMRGRIVIFQMVSRPRIIRLGSMVMPLQNRSRHSLAMQCQMLAPGRFFGGCPLRFLRCIRTEQLRFMAVAISSTKSIPGCNQIRRFKGCQLIVQSCTRQTNRSTSRFRKVAILSEAAMERRNSAMQ